MKLVLCIFFDLTNIFMRTDLLTEHLSLMLKLLLLSNKATLNIPQMGHPGVLINLSADKNDVNGSKNNEQ